MKRLRKRAKGDPVVSLINIVFLILIFFMIAGTLAKPMRGDIQFVETHGLECCSDQDGLFVSQDGQITYRGEVITSVSQFLAERSDDKTSIRIIPDRDLPAIELLTIIGELKEAGAEQIIVLTEDQGA